MSESKQGVWEAHGAWLLALSGKGDSDNFDDSQELNPSRSDTIAGGAESEMRTCVESGRHPAVPNADLESQNFAAETALRCLFSQAGNAGEERKEDVGSQDRVDDASCERATSPILTVTTTQATQASHEFVLCSQHQTSPPDQVRVVFSARSAVLASEDTTVRSHGYTAPDSSAGAIASPRSTSPILTTPRVSNEPDLSSQEREDSPILTAPSPSHEPEFPATASSEFECNVEPPTSPILTASKTRTSPRHEPDSQCATSPLIKTPVAVTQEKEGVEGLLMLSQGESVNSEPREAGKECDKIASQDEKTLADEQFCSQASTDDCPSSPILAVHCKATDERCGASATGESEVSSFKQSSKGVGAAGGHGAVAKSLHHDDEMQQATHTLAGRSFSVPTPDADTTDDEEGGDLQVSEQTVQNEAAPPSAQPEKSPPVADRSPAGAQNLPLGADKSTSSTTDRHVLGAEVEVLFSDGVWYIGHISRWRGEKAVIHLDGDGDQQVLKLPHPDVRLVTRLGEDKAGKEDERGRGGIEERGREAKEGTQARGGKEADGKEREEEGVSEEREREAKEGTQAKGGEGDDGKERGEEEAVSEERGREVGEISSSKQIQVTVIPSSANEEANASDSGSGCDEAHEHGGGSPVKRVTFYHEGANGEPVADQAQIATNLIGPWRVGQNPQKPRPSSEKVPKTTHALTAPREMHGFLDDLVFSCSRGNERLARWLPDVIQNDCVVERFPEPEPDSEEWSVTCDTSSEDEERRAASAQSCSQSQALWEKETKKEDAMRQLLRGQRAGFCSSSSRTRTECYRVRVLEHDSKNARALVSYTGYSWRWDEWVNVERLTVTETENSRLSKSQNLRLSRKVTETGVELEEEEADELAEEDLFCPSRDGKMDIGRDIEVLVSDPEEDLRVWQRGVIRAYLRKQVYRVKLHPHKDTKDDKKLVTIDFEEVFVRNVKLKGVTNKVGAKKQHPKSQAQPTAGSKPRPNGWEGASVSTRRSTRLSSENDLAVTRGVERGRPAEKRRRRGALGVGRGRAEKKGGGQGAMGGTGGEAVERGGGKGKERARGSALAAVAEVGAVEGEEAASGVDQTSGIQSLECTTSTWNGQNRSLTSLEAVEIYRLRPLHFKLSAPFSATGKYSEPAAKYGIDVAMVRDIWSGKELAEPTRHLGSTQEKSKPEPERESCLGAERTDEMPTEHGHFDSGPEDADGDNSDSSVRKAPQPGKGRNHSMAEVSLAEGAVQLDPEETALMSSLLMLDGKMAEYCQQVDHFLADGISMSRPSFEYSPTSLINISSEETAYLVSLLRVDPSFEAYCRQVQEYLGDAGAMSATLASIESAMQE